MNEMIPTVLLALSFLLSMALTVALWWAARRAPLTRRFWAALAAGWTLNLIADLGWGLYTVLGGEGQPAWTDGVYLARYVLVFAALALFPSRWPRRRWWIALGVTVVVALAVGLGMVRPATQATPAAWVEIAGGAIYPILDVSLIYAAWARWRESRAGPLEGPMRPLFLSLVAYGAANWVNYSARLIVPQAESIVPTIFWLLSTLLAGVAVWRFLQEEVE